MAKREEKIAVASSDGIVVNSHFGRATQFYIYEMVDDGAKLLEIRKVEPVCQGGNHDSERMNDTMDKISDCEYLLVSKIGYGAVAVAEQKGVVPYEIPGVIEESIQQLLNHIKIQKLFEEERN